MIEREGVVSERKSGLLPLKAPWSVGRSADRVSDPGILRGFRDGERESRGEGGGRMEESNKGNETRQAKTAISVSWGRINLGQKNSDKKSTRINMK